MYRGGVSQRAGSGLLHLGLVAEPHGSLHHDLRLPPHRVPQAAFYQEIHLDLTSLQRSERRRANQDDNLSSSGTPLYFFAF